MPGLCVSSHNFNDSSDLQPITTNSTFLSSFFNETLVDKFCAFMIILLHEC